MKTRLAVLAFTLSFVLSPSAHAAAEDAVARARSEIAEAGRLQDEWGETKKTFEGRFKAALDGMGRTLDDLRGMLDAGDEKRRDAINEAIFDVERTREDMKQVLDQLSATLAVKFTNVKNDIQENIEDARD